VGPQDKGIELVGQQAAALAVLYRRPSHPPALQPVRTSVGCRPLDRLEADRAAMLTLPPIPPVVGWAQSVRLARDHYVRLDSNDYSGHPAAIGRLVEVRADLQTVTVTLAGKLLAEHARCWARHQSLTDPAHQQAAAALRTAGHHATPPGDEVGRWSLSDYDAVFGLTDERVA
jgi:hypothetical protein